MVHADIRVLGPVELVGPHGRGELQGPRQRAVLGVLALHAGTVVARERLVDVLWDDDPPRTAVRSLHSHVARVRQALRECGLPGVLHTVEPGYLLAIEPTLVDAHRFEHEVSAARQIQPDAALETLRQALIASQELTDQHGESLIRANLGRAHLALGDRASARRELVQSLAIRERVPDSHEEARVRQHLATAEL